MKKVLSFATAGMLAIVLAGCGEQAANSPSGSSGSDTVTVQSIKQRGYITVGFANEAPYAYATPSGQLKGESVDVTKAVLKEMGLPNVQVQGVLTQFGSLIPGLQAHRFDIVTAGMYITPARAQQVSFADPDYRMTEALAVKKGNPKNLHSYTDIAKNPGVKIAVMGGAIEAQYLTKLGVPQSQIVTVPDQPSALSALEAGRADAITMTSLSLSNMFKNSSPSNVQAVQDFQQPVIGGKSVVGYGAVAFRKDDSSFREQFDQALAKLEKSGQLLQILQQNGFTKENLPGNVTAEQLSK